MSLLNPPQCSSRFIQFDIGADDVGKSVNAIDTIISHNLQFVYTVLITSVSCDRPGAVCSLLI